MLLYLFIMMFGQPLCCRREGRAAWPLELLNRWLCSLTLISPVCSLTTNEVLPLFLVGAVFLSNLPFISVFLVFRAFYCLDLLTKVNVLLLTVVNCG